MTCFLLLSSAAMAVAAHRSKGRSRIEHLAGKLVFSAASLGPAALWWSINQDAAARWLSSPGRCLGGCF